MNVPSALCLARHRGADAVVVAMGPGGVGTGSELGFGALEVGAVLDAVAWLGGTPIACLRYSTADPRPRHQVVSHHSVTALGRATHADPAWPRKVLTGRAPRPCIACNQGCIAPPVVAVSLTSPPSWPPPV